VRNRAIGSDSILHGPHANRLLHLQIHLFVSRFRFSSFHHPHDVSHTQDVYFRSIFKQSQPTTTDAIPLLIAPIILHPSSFSQHGSLPYVPARRTKKKQKQTEAIQAETVVAGIA